MTFLSLLLLYALIFAFLVFFEALYTYYYFGFGYGFSSNRDKTAKPRTKFGLRVARTLQNHLESGALAIPVLGAAAISGLESGAALTAGSIYILARIAFVVLYYAGVPMIRGAFGRWGTFPSFISFTSWLRRGLSRFSSPSANVRRRELEDVRPGWAPGDRKEQNQLGGTALFHDRGPVNHSSATVVTAPLSL